MILDSGEKVHIIERRYFQEDLRRHFIGEIMRCTENALRVKGHTWVFDSIRGQFVQRPEERQRVIPFWGRINLNVLPPEVNLSELKYVKTEKILVLTDGKKFILDISEFMGMR